MCNSQEKDPRVKAEYEVQEQKPLKIKEKCIISNCQVRYRSGDTSNGEGSLNMINEVALIDQNIAFIGQDIVSTDNFYNAKLSLFYSGEDLSFFSDDDNKNDNMRSDKDYKTKEESEEENVINFDAPDIDDSSEANIQNVNEDFLLTNISKEKYDSFPIHHIILDKVVITFYKLEIHISNTTIMKLIPNIIPSSDLIDAVLVPIVQ
ncbi:6377_t:CDS:2, partial [Scutellospora calospora]